MRCERVRMMGDDTGRRGGWKDTFNVLIVKDVIDIGIPKLLDKLARMARMHAIITCAGGDQNGRIVDSCLDIVVG
jgi:hypothetical protein